MPRRSRSAAPRPPLGSRREVFPPAHVLVGDGQGPVVLATENVRQDSDDRFTAGVAESRSELESLWSDAEAIAPDEAAGVWVRDDAVWLPYPSPFDSEGPTDLLACDDRECARGFVLLWCEAPTGTLSSPSWAGTLHSPRSWAHTSNPATA